MADRMVVIDGKPDQPLGDRFLRHHSHVERLWGIYIGARTAAAGPGPTAAMLLGYLKFGNWLMTKPHEFPAVSAVQILMISRGVLVSTSTPDSVTRIDSLIIYPKSSLNQLPSMR